jgi:DNA-binding response OmpR family regulator
VVAIRTRKVVLIIEDDLASRRIYAEELKRAGFDVVEAHNGLQGVEKASDVVPDAIVTDLGLPGIDGFELCRRIQRDPKLSAIPFLAMTGRYFSAADIARARREGCHSVLLKPFVPDDLVAEVRRVLKLAGDAASSTAKQA